MQAPNTLSSTCSLFKAPKWLGFRHDGFVIKPLKEYISARSLSENFRDGEPSDERWKYIGASTQSLLTFGLIEAVTENQVPEHELLKRGNGGILVLSLDNLPRIIQKWLACIRQTELESRRLWLKRARASLVQAHSMMIMFLTSRFAIFDSLGDDQQPMVIFIALVGEALTNAMNTVHCDSRPPTPLSWSMVLVEDYRHKVRESMLQSNWCPFTIEYFLNTKSVSCVKYVSEHSPPSDGKDHATCQRIKCVANRVDESTYTQQHTQSCKDSASKGCKFEKPTLGQVENLISRNQVPVIRIANRSEDALGGLEVLKSSDLAYVAISHVWADGLGSNTETGLPTCQLARLAAMVFKSNPEGAFWIDSLCIPQAREHRKKAIRMMARTYKEAKAVLVLDSGLQRCLSSDPEASRLLYVLTSGWMGRLWTLQEAVLADKVLFCFADALVPLRDLIPSRENLELYPYMGDMAAEIFRLIKQSQYKDLKIGDVSRSLRWRDTSRASDETLAIASLLGVDLGILLELPTQDRMIRLFQELREVPRNIVFLGGDKTDVPGYRWAPKSLMGAHGGSLGGRDLSTYENDGICTPYGLEATYMSFYFRKQTLQARSSWKLWHPETRRSFEVRGLSDSEEEYECDMLLTNEPLPKGSASPCISVLRTAYPKKLEDGSFMVPCQYKQRVVLVDLVKDSSSEEAVSLQGMGRIKVCIS
ncbi:hypothetical protein FPRO05_04295 [Fusarium proliferatum]|uniref:Heterokaryon incompatibility domain-containing protein n=1 Tax=Gibberella intermedia TaxID=948311 RepID=A0A365MRS3_GIBIN|nr:hypothetical protein FPRO05_04295 [Fusarium proliferatum]